MFLGAPLIVAEGSRGFEEQKSSPISCACFEVSRGKAEVNAKKARITVTTGDPDRRKKIPHPTLISNFSPPFHHPSASASHPPVSRLDPHFSTCLFREVGYGSLSLIVIGLQIETVFPPLDAYRPTGLPLT